MKPHLFPRRFAAGFGSIALLLSAAAAQGADVIFYAVVKTQRFVQGDAGAPTISSGHPYRLGAAVDPSASGSVSTATATAPGGAAQLLALDPIYNWLDSEAKFTTLAALDAAAPAGTYTVTMNTLHDGQKVGTLTLPADAFPSPPHVSNWGEAQAINSATDFSIRWDTFTGGTTNDGIIVLVGDLTGVVFFRSPTPFQPGALNGQATSFVIPAGTLQPATAYFIEITFFKFQPYNLTSYPGVAGLAGFDSVTDAQIVTAASPTSYYLSFRHFARGGSFLNSTHVTPGFPVSINSYRAELIANNPSNTPSASQVLFTGPAGSGLTNTPCNVTNLATATADYYSPQVTRVASPPAGTWLVNFLGTTLNFTEPDPQMASHLVIPVPSLVVTNNSVQSLTWRFFDPRGQALAGVPALVTNIDVQVFSSAGPLSYDSGPLSPGTSAYTFTNSLAWTNVGSLRFLYEDNVNYSYAVNFQNLIITNPVQFSTVTLSAGGVVLQLSGQIGRGYLVEFSTNLSQWTTLVTTNLPAALVNVTDHQAAISPSRFYRARLVN